MPFVPFPNTVQVEAIYEWNGQVVENTFYIESTAAWSESGIEDILDLVRIEIEQNLLPLLSSAIALVRLVGTLLDAVDSIAVTLNVSPPVSGGIAAESLPNNASYTITFLTSQRGRSFRGRNYVPGLTIDSVASNTIAPATRTGLLDFYTGLRAAILESNYTMVVASRISNGVPRAVGVTTPITGFTTFDTVVDSQRRRLPGRGS
jgi:hypothetical protein